MPDLVVITPSRGRPRQLNELVHAVLDTTDGRADVVGLVDLDDPKRAVYKALAMPIVTGPRRSLAGWTNFAALQLAGGAWTWFHDRHNQPPRHVASLGDDHLPRTRGWDRELIGAIEAMDGPGWAYGNDLFHGHPTAWVQSLSLVSALGWMMLPTCQHYYVDNAVLALGQAAGRIAYRPDVIVEHLHPAAGKAEADDTYTDVGEAQQGADAWAFSQWQLGGLDADARTVRAMRHVKGA